MVIILRHTECVGGYKNAVRPCVHPSVQNNLFSAHYVGTNRAQRPGIAQFGVWVPLMEKLFGIVCG